MNKLLRTIISRGVFFLHFVFYPIAFLLKKLGVRVLDVNYQAIGHLAIEPDIYLKEQKVLKRKNFTILLPPHAIYEGSPFKLKVANSFLLKCWEDHFFVITNFFAFALLYPLLKSSLLKQETRHYQATQAENFYIKDKEASHIYKKFNKIHDANCRSLIKLKSKDIERGRIVLEQQLGVPAGASYVCFSCREAGHYSTEDARRTSCRNANIENLERALTEITKREIYCIRLGSPFSAPLPASLKQISKIVDYPHTKAVSELMDIYLLSSCNFFIGNNNGLTWTAGVLGVPCVITNIVPFGVRSFFAQDIGIYKLQKSKISGKLLSFPHCLQSLLSQSINTDNYEEFQIQLIENTSEEIGDVVAEMLDRLDGKLTYSLEDELLQNRFLSMLTPYNLNYCSPARIGKSFLKKYESLLS